MERTINPIAKNIIVIKKIISVSELKNNCIGIRYRDRVKIIETTMKIDKTTLNYDVSS